MKFLTFRHEGAATVGVTDGTGICLLSSLIANAPDDMISVIERFHGRLGAVPTPTHYGIPFVQEDVLPPVLRPGKILGIGLNYRDHVEETGMALPEDQLWFAKASTSVNGPYSPIERPVVSTALDYEAELVAVVGQKCRNVDAADALAMIFGFAVGNDVSVRDWQTRTSQFLLGKSFDSHAPFGPWIATGDEVAGLDLEIASFVNGERRQHSRTSRLIFDCAAQIAHLSQVMTLEPGDLIFTGTPGGVGAAMKPARWLQPGDVVRIEIEKIGMIENRVVDQIVAPRAK